MNAAGMILKVERRQGTHTSHDEEQKVIAAVAVDLDVRPTTVPTMRLQWLVLLCSAASARDQSGCDSQNVQNDGECAVSSSLQQMTVDLLGHENETFWAYVTPDVSSFYQEAPGTRTLQRPAFRGMFGKFINLSTKPVQIYWDAGSNRDPGYIADINPFDAAGTATYPGHKFLVTKPNDATAVLDSLVIVSEQNLYVYLDPELDPTTLSPQELEKYTLQRNNLAFSEQYRELTGREWLTLYEKRNPTRYPLWEAQYFGQTHHVTTDETHFVELPPSGELDQTSSSRKLYEYRRLDQYRSPENTLNMTLTVISCAPRAFEIKSFLSDVEVDHIMELATDMTLHQSTTRASSSAEVRTDSGTRTSRNTWVTRNRSPIVDTIYRRAADLLQIDEALMRIRSPDEFPDMKSRTSIAERLQLVHYEVGQVRRCQICDVGASLSHLLLPYQVGLYILTRMAANRRCLDILQQYTPHHDFQVPLMTKDKQPSRYATILLYLNEGMKGGETSFPRWMSAESGQQLKVKPEKGKAVLFYSVLPDGNMDERSQHAALPVQQGEKWLTNLWVWDPYMGA